MSSHRTSGRRPLKFALFFPVTDEPEIVTLERRKVDVQDFRPYLQCSNSTLNAPPAIHSVRVATDRCTIYYFEQTGRNEFGENISVTRELEAEGLLRPWHGPIIVLWDQDDALTSGNVEEKSNSIIGHLSSVYEAVERDHTIEYEGQYDDEEEEEE
ncbi:hypothetical protein VNI00_018521 [Paramarasmius palmivorus]|uniref:Uncharacterized protein n=1 Tax=Paramarasmius palmivorus TaxID=297713 RepID=A0AAW0AWJ5_9AGAR